MLLNKLKYILVFTIAALFSCSREPHGNIIRQTDPPSIEPDYSGITIPYNIAPLNFRIRNKAKGYFASFSLDGKQIFRISSSDGIIKIPQKKWKMLMAGGKEKEFTIQVFLRNGDLGWTECQPVTNRISSLPVDPYITYRILYPGYESWKELSINQRSTESFRQWIIVENSLVGEDCVNCHSYNNGKTDDFLFHMRGENGGTYFYRGGEFTKYNLKTDEMKNGAVYPRWHPSGKYVAFSSNRIIQQFHSALNKKVEVSDLESTMVIYDVGKNTISDAGLGNDGTLMDTYPEWSPDGRFLYFCRADKAGEEFDYRQIHYDLYRAPFDSITKTFGPAQMIFPASDSGKSVSFPRISPDGKFIVITLHDYGCFPIWHKEADLWSIDTDSLRASRLSLNSDMTDSYHSWSSNSRWMVFSSKRTDGLTARPYIAYIDENGSSGKPFILPQKDPLLYGRLLKSFNIPEFSGVRINVKPGSIRRSASMNPISAKWAAN